MGFLSRPLHAILCNLSALSIQIIWKISQIESQKQFPIKVIFHFQIKKNANYIDIKQTMFNPMTDSGLACNSPWTSPHPFSFIRSTILPPASASGSDWLHWRMCSGGNIHEFDLIFYLANKAIPDKNGVLYIPNHMVRPRNTRGQARDWIYEITSFF